MKKFEVNLYGEIVGHIVSKSETSALAEAISLYGLEVEVYEITF